MRLDEPGWRCAAMHDPSGRRGLWYRDVRMGPEPTHLELLHPGPRVGVEVCAGREGDDAFVALAVGQTLAAADVAALAECLARAAFEYEGGFWGHGNGEGSEGR